MRYLLRESNGKLWWVEADSLREAIQQLDGFEDAGFFDRPGGEHGTRVECYRRAPERSGADWSHIGHVYDMTALADYVAVPESC